MRIMKSFLTGTKEVRQFAPTRREGELEMVDMTRQSDGGELE